MSVLLVKKATHLHTDGFHIIGSIDPASEVGKVQVHHVPPLLQTKGEAADVRMDTSKRLVEDRGQGIDEKERREVR